jgi:hypothetical protein
MAKKHLLGVAGIALIAATSTAQATAIPAPTEGPNMAVQIDKTLNFGWAPGTPPELWTRLNFDAEIRGASGWGFELEGLTGFDVALPISGGFFLVPRVSRSFGDFQLGAYAIVTGSVPLVGGWGFGLGWNLEYNAGNLTVLNDNTFAFGGGGLASVGNTTRVKFDVNEQLSVGGRLELGFSGGPTNVGLGAWAQLDLGTVKPYLHAFGSPTSGYWNGGIGLELEHQISTGPFSLIGAAEIQVDSSFGVGFLSNIGIRYSRGEVDDNRFFGRLFGAF